MPSLAISAPTSAPLTYGVLFVEPVGMQINAPQNLPMTYGVGFEETGDVDLDERYIRIVVTQRNSDFGDNYAHLALLEFEVASANTITASSPNVSFFDGVNTRSPNSTLDGSLLTWWQPVSDVATPTPTPANHAEIVFDRGANPGDFNRVVVKWYYLAGGYQGIDYTIQTSYDNVNWRVRQIVTGNTDTTNIFYLQRPPGDPRLGAAAHMLTAELYDVYDLHSRIAKLPHTKGRTWQNPISEQGSGTILFPLKIKDPDSTDFIANPDLAALSKNKRDVVRFKLRGRNVFSFFLKDYQGTLIDSQGDTSKEALEFTGPGMFGSFDRGVVYPSRGVGQQPVQKDRVFNHNAIEYDDSSWPLANFLAPWYIFAPTIFYATALIFNYTEGQPNQNYIFPAVNGPAGATILMAPEGDMYYRQWITVPANSPYTVTGWSDDFGDLNIDGQKILDLPGLTWVQQQILLTAGDHLVSGRVHNYPPVFFVPDVNPMAITFALYPGTHITEESIPTLMSNPTMKVLSYPSSPPGMTAGQVIRIVTEEMWNRGVAGWLQLMFTDTHDSAGRTWPVVADIATKVGTSTMTFLQEMAQTYVDIRVNDYGQVYAYVKDTMRTFGGTTTLRPKDGGHPTGILTGLTVTGTI